MLGEQIKFYRKTIGITQRELAKQLGISHQALGHYETGDREPSIETIKRLCLIFDITIDELLEFDTPSERKKVVINHSFNNSKDISLKI